MRNLFHKQQTRWPSSSVDFPDFAIACLYIFVVMFGSAWLMLALWNLLNP